ESNISGKLKKIPLLRGLVALIQSSANGVKHLEFSSDRFDVDPSEDEKVLQEKETSKLVMILGIGAIGVLSFLFSKLIFTITPAIVANFFQEIISSRSGQVLLEGFFKLILLLGYIYGVFHYHGAYHIVICFEYFYVFLTIENVHAHSLLYYRCGSSFILFTVIFGIFVYMFVATDPLWWRVVNRIILIPLVIGLSFEVL